MKRILFCVLFAFAATAAAEPPAILVMGDSLCAAYGLKVSEGWVSLLQQRLKQRGYDYNVVNACVSGETTAGGLSRLPGALQQHKPAIVMLELGANDGLRGTALGPVKDNLGSMLALSSKSGAKILLLGVELPPNYGPEYTGRFRAMYADFARQYRAPLVPFLLTGVAEHRELMQADGMHPLAAAEPRVLDNVWPKLLPLLKKPPAT